MPASGDAPGWASGRSSTPVTSPTSKLLPDAHRDDHGREEPVQEVHVAPEQGLALEDEKALVDADPSAAAAGDEEADADAAFVLAGVACGVLRGAAVGDVGHGQECTPRSCRSAPASPSRCTIPPSFRVVVEGWEHG